MRFVDAGRRDRRQLEPRRLQLPARVDRAVARPGRRSASGSAASASPASRYRNLTAGVVALHRGHKPEDAAIRALDREAPEAGRVVTPRPPQQHPQLVARPRREALRLERGAPLRRRDRAGARRGRGRAARRRCSSPTRSPTSPPATCSRPGGKRVRPTLTLLTAQLGEGNNPDVITAAQAVEITHLASLYHDDVMDEAQMRRGVPSAQAVWGNSVAILTGDLLFARASKLIASLGERALTIQSNTFERLVLGQLHETIGPADGRGPDRALPPGARRQDRVADRGRGRRRRHLRQRRRDVPRAGRAVRRADRRRVPADRRRHRPVRRVRDDRQEGGHRPARRRADPAAALPAQGRRIRRGGIRSARPHRT